MKQPLSSAKIIFFLPLFICLIVGCLLSCNNIVSVPASPYPISEDTFTTETLAEGFVIPYGIAILSDKEYFITDRIGKLFHFQDSVLTEIGGMPEVVTFGIPGIPAILHGGLMDISLHPNYATDAWVYVTYLPPDGYAKISRFKIKDQTAIQFEDVFKTRRQAYYGNGMRIGGLRWSKKVPELLKFPNMRAIHMQARSIQ